MKNLSFHDGVRKVFEFYGKPCPSVSIKTGAMFDTVKKDGKDIPVFYYRYYNKFVGMHNLDLLGNPCALTVYSIDRENIERILFRELYVCEYLLNSKIEHITSYRNSNSANLIVGFSNQAKAHMQIHSASCGERQFRHELFTTDGFVSDRAVDTVVAQYALNVYTENGFEHYTDADIMLYGLSEIEQEQIYAIYDIFETENVDNLIAEAKRLEKIVRLTLSENRMYLDGEDISDE